MLNKIIIADEDSTFTQLLSETLRTSNFSIAGVFHSGTGLLEAVRREKPGILLMDLMLSGTNGLAVLHELSTIPDYNPAIFIVSAFASSETSAECERLGVDFFLRKPIDVASLASLISRCSTSKQPRIVLSHTAMEQATPPNFSLRVTQILNSMHFPAHVMGYRYVRDAILVVLDDHSTADSVTKVLYPAIAKKYHTTWTSVERDIRNAISIAWDRSNGNFPGFSSLRHPTNREFILTIADHIRFELQPQTPSRLSLCSEPQFG